MPSKISYENYEYALNRTVKNTKYYRCARFSGTKCTARLIVKEDNIKKSGQHNCKVNELKSNLSEQTQAMVTVAKYAAMPNMTSSKIYTHVVAGISAEAQGGPVFIPSKRQIREEVKQFRQVNNTKTEEVLNGEIALTEQGLRFCRRHWRGDLLGKDHQVIIWASEEGLSVLRQQGQVFIDGTFRIVPIAFFQCVVIMAFDPTTNLFIPCAWSLLTGKFEHIYWILLQEMIGLLDWNWKPRSIVTDYEKGLITAIQQQFSSSTIVGCFFHFKQALARKLKKIGISQEEIRLHLWKFDFMTVIAKEDINIGLDFISRILPKASKWEEFLKYFKTTWIERFGPALWNVSECSQLNLVGRTNNALERYN
jgi:hypothetical protein